MQANVQAETSFKPDQLPLARLDRHTAPLVIDNCVEWANTTIGQFPCARARTVLPQEDAP